MAMKNVIATPEYRQDTLLEEWWNSCEKGNLLPALKKHWRIFVLSVFGNNHDPGKEERLAHKFLFRPMEYFLCRQDPEVVFEELKAKNMPSQLCGKVFKTGEPTYSCRDCANDPTCVLCIDCFQNGAHKNHRYKMNTSGGGGYCDCGDQEAWTSHPFCNLHSPNEVNQDEKNPIETLPVDLTDRASALFMAALQYIVEVLTWNQCDNLPSDLQVEGELNDTYITMLFNDEVHTFDQVIKTLQRAVKHCTAQQAREFATLVDREGRATVYRGCFTSCEQCRTIIDQSTSRHGSKPLKVQVMHTVVVAHQTFCLRLMVWLQKMIEKSDGLRRLFCLLSMKPQEDGKSLMEKLLLHDTQLWKVARILSHQLLMAGVLMDQECKKQFAVIFTKWYPNVMRDFARDDHDHEVCVASLSVQIYTVPSLARMLVTDHDLLDVILVPFLAACEEKKNANGVLSLSKADRTPSFKRACFMLYDLKYALLCKPTSDEWSDKLRESFLRGHQSFLKLLKMMQGMDEVKRQTGMHLEYEPEWEGAFNLQMRVDDVISSFTEWCSTDRTVYIEAYKQAAQMLSQCRDTTQKSEQHTVCGHTVKCLKYDVQSQPVSIHLPLSRYLAGLHVYMGDYNLQFGCPELNVQGLDPVKMIEPPLRVQVLIAQSQAGLWRRNGYALLNQIYFYHNVKCRQEMYDKDILMLQIGSSAVDSNQFLIHLLNRYGLLLWIRPEYDVPTGQDDNVRQTIMLAEEFLNLLLIILGERYVPGLGQVTHEDTLKREVIHLLCISPMSNSELSKNLPDSTNLKADIEDAIHAVANFRKPTSVGTAGSGKFELKNECYKEFNPYFYHYCRTDQSQAEETQIKRKKEEKSANHTLPPPVPPKFTPQFAQISNLLQSDVLVHILSLILQRSVAVRSRSWSETQLDRVLHLIGLALHEQRRNIHEGNHNFDFIGKALKGEPNFTQLLESLVTDPKNISHDSTKDLLSWILQKFIEVRQMTSSAEANGPVEQLASSSKEENEAAKKRKARLAAKRKEKIIAKISQMQQNFIRDNADLFESTDADSSLTRGTSEMDISESAHHETPVALGKYQSLPCSIGITKATCILCQEEQEISHNSRAMVLAGFVQRSTVMSQCKSRNPTDGENLDPLFTSSDLHVGSFTNSCGHTMHADCWQSFFQAILVKERRRLSRIPHSLSYNIVQLEYLCPLCESLSNTVIPLVPALHSLVTDSDLCDVNLSFGDWLDGLQKTVKNATKQESTSASKGDPFPFLPSSLSSITKMMADSVASNFQLLWQYVNNTKGGRFSESLMEMMKKFAKDVYSFGLGVDPDDMNHRVSIVAWNTCAYTIINLEQYLRYENKPLFGASPSRNVDCINALVKFAAVCSHIMPQEVIKKHCLRLLSGLLSNGLGEGDDPQCIIDVDMFHYLVAVTMALPSLYTEGTTASNLPLNSLNNQYILELVLTAHIVQVMLLHDRSQDGEEGGMEMENDADSVALMSMYTEIRRKAGCLPPSNNDPLPWQLTRHIKRAVLPFLRCATVLYHNLTGVPIPAQLQEWTEEVEPFCSYLSLPTSFSELFLNQGELLERVVNQWCSSDVLRSRLYSASSRSVVSYPLPVNHLIDLPDDYSQLINQISSFTCPSSKGNDSQLPTMCLVCGLVVCSQSYCCQTEIKDMKVGAATEHTYRCGAGVGILLRVRECQIVLLAGTKGCFIPAPYVDSYGETDQGLRRGNPLHLCKDSYKNLQKMWFTHCIPETVAHNIESHMNLMSIHWQHL